MVSQPDTHEDPGKLGRRTELIAGVTRTTRDWSVGTDDASVEQLTVLKLRKVALTKDLDRKGFAGDVFILGRDDDHSSIQVVWGSNKQLG